MKTKTEYHREWRAKNPEKVALANARYRENNRTALAEASRRRYQENKDDPEYREKNKVQSKRYAERNPEKVAKLKRKAWLKNNYGLTVEAYDSLFASQGNACAICGTTEPKGGKWHIDHCHETKQIRGVLCMSCNTALGMAEDSIDRLLDMANYLRACESSP